MQDGRTPLMLACIRGKEKIVGMLIERGADVQAVDAVTISCIATCSVDSSYVEG